MARWFALHDSIPTSYLLADDAWAGGRALRCYGVAVACTAVALLVKLALGPAVVPGAYITFYGAILFSTWYGGWRAGLLTTFLSAAVGDYFFLAPVDHFWPSPMNSIGRVGLFAAVGSAISWLTATVVARREQTEAMLREARDTLELRVEQRTAELADVIRALQEQANEQQRTRQELEESEHRFRATFAQAAVGIAHVASDGRFLRVNDRFCELAGYPRDDLLQRTFQSITHPEDLDTDVAYANQMLAGEMPMYSMEKRYVGKDGRARWVELTVALVHDTNGQPDYFISVVQDIGPRKRAEAALGESQNQFRTLAETVPVATFIFQGEQFLFVNSAAAQLSGYAQDELLGMRFWELVHPEQQAVVRERGATRQRGAPVPTHYEVKIVTKNGEERWADLAIGTIHFGDRLAVLGTAFDVTERKHAADLLEARVALRTAELSDTNCSLQAEILQRRQAETELAAAHAQTRNILESITDGFFALDRHGCFSYVNPAAAELMGHSRESLIGQTIWTVFPELVSSPFFEAYQRVRSERMPLSVEAYYPARNRWFKAHAYPSQEGVSVLYEDVTRRHQKEVAIVSDMLHALNAHLDVSGAFPALAAGLQQLTGCDRSSVCVFDESAEWMTVLAVSEARDELQPGSRVPTRDVPAAPTLLAGRPYLVPDLAAELASPLIQPIYARGVRSVLCVPLRTPERIAGVLGLSWRKVAGCAVAELPLLGQVADAVALAVEKNRLFDEVRAGQERLQALSRRLLEVQESERHHLARELHDEIGQGLTAIRLGLESVGRLPAEVASRRLLEMQQQVNDLVTRVRNLSLDLRPAMLDDLGLLPALLWLFERCAVQTEVQVTFEHRGLEQRFAPEIETAAYRITQEALTNIVRHARVSRATVRAWADREALGIHIADRGAGFDAEGALGSGRTSGVAGMRERVLLLGGKLAIDSTPGQGTCVVAELPLNGPAGVVA